MSRAVLSVIIGLLGITHPSISADSNTTTKTLSPTIYFHVRATRQPPECRVTAGDAKVVKEISFIEGSTVKLRFDGTGSPINDAHCDHVHNNTGLDLKTIDHDINVKEATVTASKSMNALWNCTVYTHRDTKMFGDNDTHRSNEHTYRITKCFLKVKIKDSSDSKSAGIFDNPGVQKWTIIIVGVVVVIIIAGQTGIILYFKSKARRMARLRRISQRVSGNDDDKKRYITASTPGQNKSKIAAWLAKKRSSRDDNDIYETLEELRGSGQDTPPVPPIETIPSLRTPLPNRVDQHTEISSLPRPGGGREKDISKRPPLPLPNELEAEETHKNTMEKNVKRPPIPIANEIAKEDSVPKPNMLQRIVSTQPQIKEPKPVLPSQNTLNKNGAMSIANELDNKLKLRKVSLAPERAERAPSPQSGLKRLSFLRKNSPKPGTTHDHNFPPSPNQPKFQLPEKPNPMPTGKSAVLLGLSPPPPKAAKPKPALTPKPAPTPTATPTNTLPKLPKPPPALPKTAPTLPKPTPKAVPVLPKPTPGLPKASPVLPKPSPVLPKATPVLPKVAPVLPKVVPLSQPVMPQPHPVVGNPVRGGQRLPGQTPIVKPVAPLPAPGPSVIFKPPLPSPVEEPIEEPVYEEYNEVIIQEEPEEQIYNSDEEWTYEPLDKYNIYST